MLILLQGIGCLHAYMHLCLTGHTCIYCEDHLLNCYRIQVAQSDSIMYINSSKTLENSTSQSGFQIDFAVFTMRFNLHNCFFLVALIAPAVIKAQGFFSSCENCSMDDEELLCYCRDNGGAFLYTGCDLNTCLANRNGVLVVRFIPLSVSLASR